MSLGQPKDGSERFAAVMDFRRYPRSALQCISVGADSKEEAHALCLAEARKLGWTPPAWWQWWRRTDSSEPVVHPHL